MQVRSAGEDSFSPSTRKIGFEVYKDQNVGMLLYVSETGDIAVVPAGSVTKPAQLGNLKWVAGRSFSVRRASEANFTQDTLRFGAEVCDDVHAGIRVMMTEAGGIVLSK